MLLVVAIGGCRGSDAPVSGQPFDPVRFFTGRTHGDATLRMVTGASHGVSVDSIGRSDGHGGLVLTQSIREEGKPARVRRWTIQPREPGRWSGSLTDAVGPAVVTRTANDVTIRYKMKNGVAVEQHLKQPSNGLVSNHMSVRRFGIELATLDETIRKSGK